MKCFCSKVIIACDLHAHILRYFPIMCLKMQEKPIYDLHACRWYDFLYIFSHFIYMFFILIMIMWIASVYFWSFQLMFSPLNESNKETETKLNWKHSFNNCFCRFLHFFIVLIPSFFNSHFPSIKDHPFEITTLGLCCFTNDRANKRRFTFFRQYSKNSAWIKMCIIMEWFPSSWWNDSNEQTNVDDKNS